MMQYRPSRLTAFVAVALTWLLSGCGETSLPSPAGKGAIRGINGIVTAPDLNYLIEERALESVTFQGVSGFRDWDDLDYTVNFDYVPPGGADPVRVASQYIDVVVNTEYTVVVTGSIANPTIVTWESEERTWDGTETFFEIDFAHLSPTLGQVDVYFELVDVDPVAGMEIASLSFGERIPHVEFPNGDYVLWLTAPGDPATVLYQSIVIIGSTQQRNTLGFFDPDPSKTASVGVTLFSQAGASQTLADTRFPPQVRILHASIDTGNVDGYLDENLATLVYPDVAFKDVSVYAETPGGVTPLTLTEAGNSANVLYEVDLNRFLNTRRTQALINVSDTLLTRPLEDQGRPLETYPVVRITHLASNIDAVDIYEVDPGTALEDVQFPKFFGVQAGVSTEFFATDSTGMREFVLTLFVEKDPVSAPLILDLQNGNFVDIAIVDTADPNVLELFVFDSNL
jgi:hypothetical protein